jgi:hypothetical protein
MACKRMLKYRILIIYSSCYSIFCSKIHKLLVSQWTWETVAESKNRRENSSAIEWTTKIIQLWLMIMTMTDLETILTLNPLHSISQMCWDRGPAVSIYSCHTSRLFKHVPPSVGIIWMLRHLMILTTVICIGKHIMVVGMLLIVVLVHC